MTQLMMQDLTDSVKILLNGVGEDILESYLSSDIGFSTGVQYSSAGVGQAQMDKINQIAGSAINAINATGLTSVTQQQIKSLTGSILNWNGTDPFGLVLPMVFVALTEGYDVRKPVKELWGAQFPKIEGTLLSRYSAPNDYAPGKATSSEGDDYGTISVKIGSWFRSPPLFLISASDFTFSQVTMADSELPLFARGSVTLIPYRDLSSKEVTSFITSSPKS